MCVNKNLICCVLSSSQAKQHMALLCLGEIGRRKDLSNHVQIENIVIESFQSPFEEIKSAASYALGNIAVGNLSKYLPFILDQIDNQQKKQYLLLHSLKEVYFYLNFDLKMHSPSNCCLTHARTKKLPGNRATIC